MPTHRLILTSTTSSQTNSNHPPIFESIDKRSHCAPMLLSLSNPVFPDESPENLPSDASHYFQLPLDIFDQQLRQQSQQISDDRNKTSFCSSDLPHLPLHSKDRKRTLKRRETSQSSAEIDDMLRSWRSDHFKISPSAPKNISSYEIFHLDQGSTLRYSGMKRSPICTDLRCLDNCESDGGSTNNELDHFQNKRRSIDTSSHIGYQEYEGALSF